MRSRWVALRVSRVPACQLSVRYGSTAQEPPKQSKLERDRALWTEYRWPFACYYGVMWAAPIVPIWLGLQSGFDGVAALKYLGKWRLCGTEAEQV